MGKVLGRGRRGHCGATRGAMRQREQCLGRLLNRGRLRDLLAKQLLDVLL